MTRKNQKPKRIETTLVIPPAECARIYADLQRMIDDCPTRIPTLTVAEFAAKHRRLPRGTPYPGPWKNERTPYLVEIMECLSASSPIREIILAKSAQVGATAMIENLIAYVIRSVPGPILYCTANEKLLKKWVNKRLTPLLVSCGLEGKLVPQHVMKGQRRTGNTMFSKEFPGGSLDMTTAGSAAGMRMDSIRNLILDEVDGYAWNVDKEGDPVSIAEARTKAWKKRKKILYTSTPTTFEESHIWPLYESGDRRRYQVPCPFCGERQTLEFGYSDDQDETDNGPGLKWELTDGLLDERSIYYQCANCDEPIPESKKYEMVQAGQWEPTARSGSPYRRSYHISAVYSLMEDWATIIQTHINSEDQPLKRRAFVNTDLGLPYRELGSKPNPREIQDQAGDYKSGIIPDYQPGPLFLTMAVDVQAGRKRSTEFGPRLELEVCAHGRGYRTWSIVYKVFRGPINDPFAGAWEQMHNWAAKGGLVFHRSDGFRFSPQIIGIDSADGKVQNIVFQFCQRWNNTFPIKGFRSLKKTTGNIDEVHDAEMYSDTDRFRERKKSGTTTYQISTNWYKKQVYQNLKIKRRAAYPQRPNFMDHPSDYPDDYYKMLTAEEQRDDGTFWKPSSRRNEALDLKVYNICLQEIWLSAQVLQAQRAKIKDGAAKEAVEKLIRTPYVLDYLERKTARRSVA